MGDRSAILTGRPRPEVSLHFVGDSGVLFDATAQRLYGVNTTAAFIWCCLEDEMEAPVIASRLCSTFGFEPLAAATHVAVIVRQWEAMGLTGAQSPPVAVTTQMPKTAELLTYDAAVPTPVQTSGVTILGVPIRLRIGTRLAADRLSEVLDLTGSVADESAVMLDVVGEKEDLELRHGHRILERCDSPDQLAPAAKVALLRLALEKSSDFCAVHGAAVALEERCILMPGASGSGKSTLAAALMAEGLSLLGDDTIVLSRDSLAARPLPFGICIKDGSVPALESRFPGLAGLPIHERLDGKQVRYLVPSPSSLARPDATYDVTAIVFPRFQPGSPTKLGVVAKAQALERLLSGFLPLSEALDSWQVEQLASWINGVPCFDLHFSSLDDAVERLVVVLE